MIMEMIMTEVIMVAVITEVEVITMEMEAITAEEEAITVAEEIVVQEVI
jgi:hypothetical protein